MIKFEIKLMHGNSMTITPESVKSKAVSIAIKDKDGKSIAFGYCDKDEIVHFAKAL